MSERLDIYFPFSKNAPAAFLLKMYKYKTKKILCDHQAVVFCVKMPKQAPSQRYFSLFSSGHVAKNPKIFATFYCIDSPVLYKRDCLHSEEILWDLGGQKMVLKILASVFKALCVFKPFISGHFPFLDIGSLFFQRLIRLNGKPSSLMLTNPLMSLASY